MKQVDEKGIEPIRPFSEFITEEDVKIIQWIINTAEKHPDYLCEDDRILFEFILNKYGVDRSVFDWSLASFDVIKHWDDFWNKMVPNVMPLEKSEWCGRSFYNYDCIVLEREREFLSRSDLPCGNWELTKTGDGYTIKQLEQLPYGYFEEPDNYGEHYEINALDKDFKKKCPLLNNIMTIKEKWGDDSLKNRDVQLYLNVAQALGHDPTYSKEAHLYLLGEDEEPGSYVSPNTCKGVAYEDFSPALKSRRIQNKNSYANQLYNTVLTNMKNRGSRG